MTGIGFILINDEDDKRRRIDDIVQQFDDEAVIVQAIMRHHAYRDTDPALLAVELDVWSPNLIAALAASLRKSEK
jgi:hypothetical protein